MSKRGVRPSAGSRSLLLVGLGFGMLFGIANVVSWASRAAGIWLIVLSIVAFGMYMFDKDSARRGARRTSEYSLLLLAALGGTLGAGLAMLLFRHKTAKGTFLRSFWLIVGLQITGLVLAVALRDQIINLL